MSSEEHMESNKNFFFNPPVYIQRYTAVRDILSEDKWKNRISKIVDFGCSELNFFKFIKSLDHIRHYSGVDIDEEVIRDNEYKIKPLTFEYVIGFSRKFIVDLFVGSIAELDTRLFDVDAVICIELIEHLHPHDLKKLPSTVFEYLQPELAIFTTPNADFNVFFNLKTFRHTDHKFEWTRKEFEEWCFCIVKNYQNYEVYFMGIGAGPESTEHLGCCSQLAVFSKKSDIPMPYTNLKKTEPYKLYERIIYPFKEDNRNEEQKFIDEVKYRINNVKKYKYREFQKNDCKYEIPFTYLWHYLKQWCSEQETLIDRLLKMGYLIKMNDENLPVLVIEEDTETESDEFSDEDYNDVLDKPNEK